MKKAWQIAGVVGVMLLVGGLVYAFDPTRVAFFPPCVFHKLTGLHCPGCGTTRALHQLTHGHLVAALHMNALTFVVMPLIGWLMWSGRGTEIKPIWIWALTAALVLFGVLRNIPVYPLTLLAPVT